MVLQAVGDFGVGLADQWEPLLLNQFLVVMAALLLLQAINLVVVAVVQHLLA
jgi:hypothetical protein